MILDRLGQPIEVGSIVCAPDTKTSMFIGRVIKITPKQLRLENLDSAYKSEPYKYHKEVVCIDHMQETIMYMIKRGI